MRHPPHPVRASLALLLAAVLAAGCTDAMQPVAGVPGAASLAAAPAGSSASIFEGDLQVAVVNDSLQSMNVVRVVNASGAPVPNVSVTWTVTSGGGRVVRGGTTTNSTGRAYARWKLGGVVGFQTLRATAEGAGSVTFNARGISTGSRLSAPNLGCCAEVGWIHSFGVSLRNPGGEGIPGARITASVVDGGGSSFERASFVTKETGGVSIGWKMGPVPGEHRAVLRFPGLPPLEISTNARMPGARVTLFSGDGQTGTYSDSLTQPFVVRLVRADGTPIQGATVNWSGREGTSGLKFARTTTNSTGRAYNLYAVRYGHAQQQVTATVGAVGAVQFVVNGVPDGRQQSAESGSGQSGYPGDSLPAPLVLRVLDQGGRPIHGAAVRWRTVGGGTLRAATTFTDAQGRAVNRWALGAVPGTQQVLANVDPSPNVVFTATAVADPAPKIAYSSNRFNARLLSLIRTDGTGRHSLGASASYSGNPDWSPDGTRLVYMRSDDVGVMNPDGTNDQTLLWNSSLQSQPRWSPRGDRILFVGYGPSGNGLYTIGFNIIIPPTLLRSEVVAAGWSHDGTRIVFAGGSAEPGLWVMDADGTDPVKIAESGTAPSWSPDGTRIAYQGWNDCVCNDGLIMIIPAAGGTPVSLGRGSTPDWSPDGLQLAFTENGALLVMDADGTDRRVLDTPAEFYITHPSWRPTP